MSLSPTQNIYELLFYRILHLGRSIGDWIKEIPETQLDSDLCSQSVSHPGSFHSTCQSVLGQDPDNEDQPPLLQLHCVWCLISTSLLGILPECECMGERDPALVRLFSLIWLLFSQWTVSFSSPFIGGWAGNVAPVLWLYAFPQRFTGQII